MCLGNIFNYIGNVYNIMFYTLVTKSFIKNIRTSKNYLYIFLTGSVGYILIHWYLHMDIQTGIKQTLKHYLYYVMILDAFIAYSMIRMYAKSIQQDSTEDEIPKPDVEYTPEQKMIILQKMQETRRLQQLAHKEHMNLTNEKENDIKDAKQSIFTKSEESNEESSNKKTSTGKNKETIKVVKKVSDNVNDTEIPVYKNNNN